jgi:hypothetical protein
MKYKVLSLDQPWATLVAIGAKKVETRSWETLYRGELLIHATRNYPVSRRGLRFDEPFYGVLWRAGIKPDMPLPLGAILASVDLADCWLIQQGAVPNIPELVTSTGFVPVFEPERSFGNYAPGRFGWVFSNTRKLPTPIPARGCQKLWTWEGQL